MKIRQKLHKFETFVAQFQNLRPGITKTILKEQKNLITMIFLLRL